VSERLGILRKSGSDDEFGFESLKREGLRLVQEISGELWTDFNAHDPGVTILDALCYALTDLIYRADFPVADFLTADDGRIDLDALALHPPEDILPCRPTTFADYRRLILDRFPEIDNAWLTRSTRTGVDGLCRIDLRLGPEAMVRETVIVEEVRQLFCRTRNLCEDIDEITVVAEQECELHALIEIGGGVEPAEILAGVYHACARHIAGNAGLNHPDDAPASGKGLDELLDGPATGLEAGHAVAPDNDAEEVLVADLFAIAKGIDGVSNVKRLWLRKEGRDYFDAIDNRRDTALLRLRIPEKADEIGIQMESSSGRGVPIQFQEFRTRFNDLDYLHRSSRRAKMDLSSIFPRPQGTWRNLQEYSSVQHLLPAIYGINEYGVPESAEPEVKGRAAQLKGYLLLFDQVMANYAANLQNLRHLFAIDPAARRSYATQTVENKGYPPLEGIYPENPDQSLTALLHRFDPYPERKNRVLDYLLALHGETFPHNTLRSFVGHALPHECDAALLKAKAAYLQAVAEVGRDRGGAFDYTANPGDTGNLAGFQKRVCLLLGFDDVRNKRLTTAFARLGLQLGSFPAAGEESGSDAPFAAVPEPGNLEREYRSIPVAPVARPADLLPDFCRQTIPHLGTLFPSQLLRGGVRQDNFRLAAHRQPAGFPVLFRDEESGRWRNLALFADEETAIETVNALRALCIRLNRESEGMHVVEHILLRPPASEHHGAARVDEGFYRFRMTLLFPAWSALCHDPHFREMADNLVRMNVPAHIYPHILWLDFPEMLRFELVFKEWLKKKSAAGADPAELAAAAGRVVDFLCPHLDTQSR